jgi:hypothetical protein
MADEFRGDSQDRDRVTISAALAVLLLLTAGSGTFLAVRHWAARQAELRPVEAERAARDAGLAAVHPREQSSTPDKPQVFTGRVVRRAGAVGAAGGLDLDGADGRTYPIVADAGSLKLALDARLRDRPVRLTALPVPDGLRVVGVQTVTGDGVCDGLLVRHLPDQPDRARPVLLLR